MFYIIFNLYKGSIFFFFYKVLYNLQLRICFICRLIWFSESSGRTHTWFCALLQYLSLYGTDIASVITTATRMRHFHCE
jgi:hypothetical protein